MGWLLYFMVASLSLTGLVYFDPLEDEFGIEPVYVGATILWPLTILILIFIVGPIILGSKLKAKRKKKI